MEEYIGDSVTTISSTISKSTKIYRNCRIEKSILSDDTVIGENSVVFESELGKHVELNRNSMIRNSIIGDFSYGGMGMTVVNAIIGKYNSISWNVSIGGANHDYTKITNHAFLYNKNFGMLVDSEPMYNRFTKECVIENDVWIGAGAQILRNVRIGNGAVIGANAVVNKDVPPYSIVVGVPAKIIGKRFDNDIIERLLFIKWWDFPPNLIRDNIDIFNCQPTHDLLNRIEELKKNM